jgi:hypothetical protein
MNVFEMTPNRGDHSDIIAVDWEKGLTWNKAMRLYTIFSNLVKNKA